MPRLIRVLHLIDSLAPGGAERVLVELVNHLNGTSIAPVVCISRGDSTLAQDIHPDIPIHQLHRQGTWDRRGLRKLGQIVRSSSIDIVHAHGYSSSRFAVAAKAYNFLRTPIIMHAHDYQPPDRATKLMGCRGIAHFIGVAPKLVETGQSVLHFTEQKTSLLGNAIDPTHYMGSLPASRDTFFNHPYRFIGLVIANVRPVKNFETLFRALAASRFKGELGVLIAGSLENEAYVRECRSLIDELGLSDSVVFLGSRRDLPMLLAAADCTFLSSEDETGPMALLEYMAAARPFVSTLVGQIGAEVAAAGIPALVPPRDYAAFAREIDNLLSLPEAEREQRGMAGQQLLLQKFSIKARIERLEEIYRSLV
jgi:glycosyltransferase involved in cell wall biosynthesis